VYLESVRYWIAPALLITACLAAPHAPAQEQFPELLKNGDFAAWDKWPGSWDIFTGAKNGEGPLSQVAQAEGGGLRLAGDAATKEWRSAAQAFPAAPETLYRLEFEAKVAGRVQAPGQYKNCYVGLVFFGAGKQRLAMRVFDVRSEQWRAGRLGALSPAGTASGSVFIVLTQTGTLRVRNVSLKQAPNDPLANYDLLVSEMDQRYSYFAHKKIDWRALAAKHRGRARAGVSAYGGIQRLLQELNDPHVVVIPKPDAPPVVTAKPNTERNFDLTPLLARIHKQQRTGMQMITGQVKEGFGYALVGSLQPQMTTAEAMAKAFEALYDRPGIILDLRANGGGDERVAQTILRGLVQQRTVYAQSRTRAGPAPDDFTPPQHRVLHVSRDAAVPRYTKPVVALIGPVCMSSGEAMALMCKALPNVTVIGLPTRGASGNPKPIQLPNGVQVLASTWVAMDAHGTVFEGKGIQPDERVAHGPDDPTLSRAIAILTEQTKE
jgi:hypothetical protein